MCRGISIWIYQGYRTSVQSIYKRTITTLLDFFTGLLYAVVQYLSPIANPFYHLEYCRTQASGIVLSSSLSNEFFNSILVYRRDQSLIHTIVRTHTKPRLFSFRMYLPSLVTLAKNKVSRLLLEALIKIESVRLRGSFAQNTVVISIFLMALYLLFKSENT